QQWDTGNQSVAVQSMPPKKRFFSPLVIAGITLLGLFLLGGVAIGGAYMAGLFGGSRPSAATASNSSTPELKPVPAPGVPIKAEMIQIPGGSFRMGRDGGDLKESPAYAVDVGRFWMDKTEVTNGEYLEFVKETGYAPPKHWVNGRPLDGTEMVPVRYVALDDTEAFAKWRSKRDGFKYRLPTEQEWEYAARNGGKNNLFPWGNEWNDGVSIMGVTDSEPSDVGSKPQGKNEWGVVDLIGNVWEWTGSELKPYPGSNVVVEKKPGKRIVVRGGSAHEDPAKVKVTSTFRVDVAADQKEKTIGFRLVRSE
nr:SUMF1/EgtB/PvdO family nonheme iron enzyme [Blastocatellia bacterium]